MSGPGTQTPQQAAAQLAGSAIGVTKVPVRGVEG